MAKSTIGFVIGQLGGGGAERVVSNLCNYFSSKGHAVFVFLISDYSGSTYPLEKKISLVHLKSCASKNPFAKISELTSQFQRLQIDIVVGFNTTPAFYAAKAAFKLGIPCISCAERNSPQDYGNSVLWNYLKKRSFSLSTKIVFQTTGARDFFPRKFARKSLIIPNPLPPDFICQPREISKVNPVIVMLGRVDEQKNNLLALKAFKDFQSTHKTFTLEIYGKAESSYAQNLKKDFQDDSIHFLGFNSFPEDVFSRASMFLLSSNYEGISNSLLEALASGVPCVSTDCRPGGSRALIQNTKGSLLCQNGDQKDMVRCLSSIADRYSFFFENAKEDSLLIRQKYSSENIGSQWEELFECLHK